MAYTEFYSDIKHNTIAPIYIFFGKEEYLIKKALEKAVDEFIDKDYSDFNLTIFDGKNMGAGNIVDTAETMPFFCDKKLVIVKECTIFKSQKTGLSDIDVDRLNEYFKNPLRSTIIIFCLEDKPDKRRSLYKNFSKNGKVIEFSTLDKITFPRWIQKVLSDANKKASSRVIDYLVNSSGYLEYNSSIRLYDVMNELNKLISYTGLRDNITMEDIDVCWKSSVEKSIFDMVDALGYKRADDAFKISNKLIYEGEPAIKIMMMISRHYRNLFKIKIYEKQGYSPSAIASKMKLSPFILKRHMMQIKNCSISELKKYITICIQSEYELKSGKIAPKLCMELLMMQLVG